MEDQMVETGVEERMAEAMPEPPPRMCSSVYFGNCLSCRGCPPRSCISGSIRVR